MKQEHLGGEAEEEEDGREDGEVVEDGEVGVEEDGEVEVEEVHHQAAACP